MRFKVLKWHQMIFSHFQIEQVHTSWHIIEFDLIPSPSCFMNTRVCSNLAVVLKVNRSTSQVKGDPVVLLHLFGGLVLLLPKDLPAFSMIQSMEIYCRGPSKVGCLMAIIKKTLKVPHSTQGRKVVANRHSLSHVWSKAKLLVLSELMHSLRHFQDHICSDCDWSTVIASDICCNKTPRGFLAHFSLVTREDLVTCMHMKKKMLQLPMDFLLWISWPLTLCVEKVLVKSCLENHISLTETSQVNTVANLPLSAHCTGS